MSMMQRSKGKRGESELAGLIRDLTGWDAQRRVRQHDGDSDVVGVPGWSIEVKRHKSAGRGQIAAWWRQTEEQARVVATSQENGSEGRLGASAGIPVLFYRVDRAEWRAVWPLAVTLTAQDAVMWRDYEWTVEGTVAAWAAVAREVVR
jgi:hypothetical protein